jgi:hypothetical protein
MALTETSLPQVWHEVVSQVGGFLANHLKPAGLPAISGPNTLVLRFPAGYNHESEFCQKASSSDRIEKVLRGVAGAGWNLRIQSEGGTATNLPPPATDGTENSLSRTRRLREEAEKEPLIRKAMAALGAEIVRVDEGFGALPAAGRGAETADTEET